MGNAYNLLLSSSDNISLISFLLIYFMFSLGIRAGAGWAWGPAWQCSGPLCPHADTHCHTGVGSRARDLITPLSVFSADRKQFVPPAARAVRPSTGRLPYPWQLTVNITRRLVCVCAVCLCLLFMAAGCVWMEWCPSKCVLFAGLCRVYPLRWSMSNASAAQNTHQKVFPFSRQNSVDRGWYSMVISKTNCFRVLRCIACTVCCFDNFHTLFTL